jgi:biopolymer transport protein TolR
MSLPTRILNTDINVTPFLDILLVLIITFLAAVTARKTMDATLPVPCEGPCATNDVPIMLEVLADGSFLLNRAAVPAPSLLATLHRAFDGRPDKVLQVAGHRDASYQGVLAAMDVARSAGVTVIAIPPSDSYAPSR